MITRTIVLLAILLSSACHSGSKKITNTNNSDVTSEKYADIDFSKTSLATTIYETVLAKDIEAGKAKYLELKDSEDYYFLEEEMNRAGFALYQSGRKEDAFAVFKWNENLFPETGIAIAQTALMKHEEQGLDKTLDWYKSIKDNKSYFLNEREMNIVGYILLRSEKVKDAIAFFQINVDAFPKSSNVYDSLAEAYLADGDKEMARKYYKKSVDVSPDKSFMKWAFNPTTTYQPTVIPNDTTQLFEYRGNLDQDTVYLFCQGGPLLEYDIEDYDPFRFMPNYKNFLRVYAYQSQMINPDMVSAMPNLTKEQGAFEHHQSAEMLYRTIEYFKNRSKVVFAVGHSYGTMISLEYFLTKKNIADKHIIMGTSLDVDLRNFQPEDENNIIRWKDGVEPYEKSLFENMPAMALVGDRLNGIFRNIHQLVENHGKRRFTKLLEDQDWSNIIFIHGTFDESSGRTEKYVLDFLRSKNAKVVETYGDHHSMFSYECMTDLYHHLTQNQPLKKSVASALAHTIEDKGIEYLPDFTNSTYFHPINESEMNSLGYQLLKYEKIKEAIKIFQINVENFPNSANAYDSLAEGYFNDKNNTLAKLNYEKSIELNPNNQNAISMLEKIKGK